MLYGRFLGRIGRDRERERAGRGAHAQVLPRDRAETGIQVRMGRLVGDLAGRRVGRAPRERQGEGARRAAARRNGVRERGGGIRTGG